MFWTASASLDEEIEFLCTLKGGVTAAVGWMEISTQQMSRGHMQKISVHVFNFNWQHWFLIVRSVTAHVFGVNCIPWHS